MLQFVVLKHQPGSLERQIVLRNLTAVSYLVGENGSGKSQVLNYIHTEHSAESALLASAKLVALTAVLPSGLHPVSDQITQNQPGVVGGVDCLAISAHLAPDDISKAFEDVVFDLAFWRQFRDLLNFIKIDVRAQVREGRFSMRLKTRLIQYDDLVAGSRQIFDLIFNILLLHRTKNISLFLLEEPEYHLYSRWQKKLPYLLGEIARHLQIQIFVATHSPFVISSVGEITEREREKYQSKSQEFQPSQKVFFLKQGSTASKDGQIKIDHNGYLKGSFGYWGRRCNHIANKMLGAGLIDLIFPQEASEDGDAPQMIFCEGQGNREDAKIYNAIFHTRRPQVLFVSCRGSSQLHKSFELLQEIKVGLSANLNTRMLRDRDHEFSSEAEIRDYELHNPGSRVLRRRALECYLYNSETAELLLKTQRKRLNNKLQLEMNELQHQIQLEAEQGITGDNYKIRLKELFKTMTKSFSYYNSKVKTSRNLDCYLGELIQPGTLTYHDLAQSIFN